MFFMNAVLSARQRVWLTTPYFVPDQGFLRALQLAAERNVDVRLLIPSQPDHIVVFLASLAYVDLVQAAGVRVYMYREGFFHQKVMLVDSSWASVGTVNLDYRSFFLNFELTTIIFDAAFPKETAAMLEEDLRNSDKLPHNWFSSLPIRRRLASTGARLFSSVL